MHIVLPNVKAHLVVTLVVFLATSLAIGDATHEGVVHHPHIMELLPMAPPSGLNKRHLRSSPEVTSSDTNGVEERANLEGVAANAKEIKVTVVSLMNTLRGWVTNNPDTTFASLRLHEIKVGLLSNTKFLKWEALVKKKYGNAANRVIMKTMIGQCEDVASEAMIIFKGTPTDLGVLQRGLLSKWRKRNKNLVQLLQEMNPGGDANALFDNSPLFQAWTLFAEEMGVGARDRLDILTKAYTVPGVVQALSTATKDLYAGRDLNKVENEFAESLAQEQLYIWYENDLSEKEVLEKLLIDEADTTSRTSLVHFWLDYVLMRAVARNENEAVGYTQIESFYGEAVLNQLKELSAEKLLDQVSTEWRAILTGTESYYHFLARYRRVVSAIRRGSYH